MLDNPRNLVSAPQKDKGSLWVPEQLRAQDHQLVGDTHIIRVTRDTPDLSRANDPRIQRAEMRLGHDWRPEYGQEFWCEFDFKLTGDKKPDCDTRIVAGQWKSPGDNSPIIAQRFTGGQFYITTQDADKQIVLAQEGTEEPDVTKRGIEQIKNPSGLTVKGSLPSPWNNWVKMTYRIKAGRSDNLRGSQEPGVIEVFANDVPVAKYEGDIGRIQTDDLPTDMFWKFGVYRDKMADGLEMHLKNWSIAPSREELDHERDMAASCAPIDFSWNGQAVGR